MYITETINIKQGTSFKCYVRNSSEDLFCKNPIVLDSVKFFQAATAQPQGKIVSYSGFRHGKFIILNRSM